MLPIRRCCSTCERTTTPRAEFAVGSGGIRLDGPAELPAGILSESARSTTLVELAAALRVLPRGEFAWVDFHIGSLFQTESAAKGGWNASDLWEKALSEWRPWFLPG